MARQKLETDRKSLGYRLTNRRTREKYKDFLCVLPALALLAVFVYYPIADLVRLSLYKVKTANLGDANYEFVGLKNYEWVLSGNGKNDFWNSLTVTLKYTFFEVAITIVVGILLALLFNRASKPFAAMRAIVFMPRYVAMSVASVVFMWMLHADYGIINNMLGMLGINPINWMNDPNYALVGILMLTSWRVVGYSMMLYLSAMRGIAKDYYEAAAIDGASKNQQFWRITLPLLSPTTLFITVTTFISAMKIFQSIDVMTSGGPNRATNVMVYWIYDLAFRDFRIDRAAAVSVLFFIVLIVFTLATMKISNRSVNYDA